MTITFQLAPPAADTCALVGAYAQQTAARQAWPLGVCEMAAGAAVLTAGLASRSLRLGADLVLHPLVPGPLPSASEEAACSVLGLLPLLMLEKTGVADRGPALAMPALALLAGGGVLLDLAGCRPGPQARQFLAEVPQGSAALAGGARLAAGIALFVQGAQRLVPPLGQARAGAWLADDRLALPALPKARRVITRWTGVAAYANDLGALTSPSGALGQGAAKSAEHGLILRALHARPLASQPLSSGFGLSGAGIEAE
jgi:hypothetical protein